LVSPPPTPPPRLPYTPRFRSAPPRPAGSLIVTPHPGEMARLTGLAPAEIAADRPGVAARYAGAWGCTLVLKGHRTIVAAPDGRLDRKAHLCTTVTFRSCMPSS